MVGVPGHHGGIPLNAGIIECAFQGRIGSEPTVRDTRDGNRWISFSVAVAAGGDGETQWLRVSHFGNDAVELARQLGKGQRVYVEGRLRLADWVDQRGDRRFGLQVTASLVQTIGRIGNHRRVEARRSRKGRTASRSSDNPDSGSAVTRQGWQQPAEAEAGAAEGDSS